ncbi:MAG: hypothetical protein D5R96_06105 [Methanocalculus sp. MSAO_Arc2]|uniref:hypothetical protein n=1 Tax=Methanocalculus sp. MSAO_Arc2 TaxID=2293855 RepID=UPI000FF2E7AB|nr:MAG: hypothetical protein D5R96_06105 [Methanocalculus sp. MSAO_Arc2]
MISFISIYASRKNVRSLLCVPEDTLQTVLELKDAINPERAVAVTEDRTRMEPAGVTVVRGDPITVLSHCSETFDLIVSAPRFEKPVADGDQPSETDDLIQYEEQGRNQIILESALHLSPEGALFTIVPPGFFENGEMYHTLQECGLSCEAVFSLPRGLFVPVTGARCLLVIIRKKEINELMAGELSADPARWEILLQNIHDQKNGKKPELGIFVRASAFRSLDEILLKDTIRKLATEHGTPPIPFSGITRSITVGACGTPQDAGRRIYLPFAPDEPPVTSAEDLPRPSVDAACIILRQDAVDSGYLIRFFETELGRAIRELIHRRAGTIHHFSEALAEAEIYLPPPQVQVEAIRMDSIIESMKGDLHSIQRDLFAHPYSTRSARERLDRLRSRDEITDWIETLPFPLASILWAYIAENSPSKKVGHLFHFFEASAECIAGILLSAIAPIIRREGIDLLDDNPEFRDVYQNATFRSWIILCRRAGRQIRTRLSSHTEQEGMVGLFGKPGREFIDMVTNKRLFSLFDEVADLRNDWKGHGGIVGEREYEQRLVTLESYLIRCRETIRDHFGDVMLIRPGAGEYHDGIFTYQVKSLTGSRPRFQVTTISSLIPLDTRKLYLYPRDSGEPLELLPFFRLVEHPATGEPAWYFYNRIEGKRVRWVSYHYEAVSEFEEDNEEVYAMMRHLRLITGDLE